jgi:CheY-like chemotaxis protein
VLVVEDDEGVRDVLAVLLNIEGCEARTASDGEAALALLRSWQPDLILLDVVMPGMDGPAFVRAYRETSEPHAPIILLTGNEDRGDLVAELGAVASLPKPFTVEAFLDVLNKFITC